MQAQFVVSEASLGLRRNLTMTIASIMTTAIMLTLLGGALMIRTGTNNLRAEIFNQIEVSVYLKTACGVSGASPTNCSTPDEQASVQKTLQSLPQVKKVTFISAEQARQLFIKQNKNNQALINETKSTPLPESFEVELKDPSQFQIVNSAVSQAPGVDLVANASSTINGLLKFFHAMTRGALALALVALIAALLLIYNSIRIAAFTRRRETGIMRLVGASDFYIQAPFVLEGTICGALGSVLALVLLGLGRLYFAHSVGSFVLLEPFVSWHALYTAVPLVVVVGIGMSAITSVVTLQRHMRV